MKNDDSFINTLEQYGKLEILRFQDNSLHIKITDGFSTNAMRTMELLKSIDKYVGLEYSVITKCVTDNNLFDYIISKPKL